jgi:hypothetical protein
LTLLGLSSPMFSRFGTSCMRQKAKSPFRFDSMSNQLPTGWFARVWSRSAVMACHWSTNRKLSLTRTDTQVYSGICSLHAGECSAEETARLIPSICTLSSQNQVIFKLSGRIYMYMYWIAHGNLFPLLTSLLEVCLSRGGVSCLTGKTFLGK